MKKKGVGIKTFGTKLTYYKHNLKIVSSDGKKFRSEQEREIYDRLLKCKHLTINYDFPISTSNEKKYADFKILNLLKQKAYFWEHFGMTDSPNYLDKMVEKVEWYKSNGFKTVEEGGNIIYTVFSDSLKFQKDIDKYIDIITR